jgi:hypothetical protein
MRFRSPSGNVETLPPPHEIGEELVNERPCHVVLPRFATDHIHQGRDVGRDHRLRAQSDLGMWPGRGLAGDRALTRGVGSGTSLDVNRATEPIPQADLSSEVWTITHIAAYFQVRLSAAYDKAREPGFPAPLGEAGRFRRWLGCQVREYAAQPPRRATDVLSVPSSAGTLRPRKVAA